jgi:hypothetical protein
VELGHTLSDARCIGIGSPYRGGRLALARLGVVSARIDFGRAELAPKRRPRTVRTRFRAYPLGGIFHTG